MSHKKEEIQAPTCKEAFQEPQNLKHVDTKALLRVERVPEPSPMETRFQKFSSIMSWYSFLWAKSSRPSSSLVKVTATSLKDCLLQHQTHVASIL